MPDPDLYAVTWDLRNTPLGELGPAIEKLRQYGLPTTILDLPTTGYCLVLYAVGEPAGSAADLWELRGLCEETARDLDADFDNLQACTGALMPDGSVQHDKETCPVHEATR